MKQKFDLKQTLKNEKLRFSVLFLSLGLISYLVSRPDQPAPSIGQEVVQLDNYIPEGYVLLPLEILNREALSSIISATAVIDLFSVNPQSMNPSKKIASRIKLLRTPRNPEQFAILVKESETSLILQTSGPYFAVIQNKSRGGDKLIKEIKTQKIEISYQE